MFISPANWLVLIPLLALLLNRLGWLIWARCTWALEIGLILLIGAYPVGQWLAEPLESYSAIPVPDAPAPDGINVLSGAWQTEQADYWQQWELNHAAERELAFLMLAERYPAAKLVFTGGSGRVFSQGLKEAHWAQALYRDFGLDQQERHHLYRRTIRHCGRRRPGSRPRGKKQVVDVLRSRPWRRRLRGEGCEVRASRSPPQVVGARSRSGGNAGDNQRVTIHRVTTVPP